MMPPSLAVEARARRLGAPRPPPGHWRTAAPASGRAWYSEPCWQCSAGCAAPAARPITRTVLRVAALCASRSSPEPR
jgi:hypothetical protein